jgi:hypothetical protein
MQSWGLVDNKNIRYLFYIKTILIFGRTSIHRELLERAKIASVLQFAQLRSDDIEKQALKLSLPLNLKRQLAKINTMSIEPFSSPWNGPTTLLDFSLSAFSECCPFF